MTRFKRKSVELGAAYDPSVSALGSTTGPASSPASGTEPVSRTDTSANTPNTPNSHDPDTTAAAAPTENWLVGPILTSLAAPFAALAPLLIFIVAPPVALVMAFTRLSARAWAHRECSARAGLTAVMNPEAGR